MKKCPCKGNCPDRKSGCHATCKKEEYIEWCKYWEQVREGRKREFMPNDFFITSSLKNRKD